MERWRTDQLSVSCSCQHSRGALEEDLGVVTGTFAQSGQWKVQKNPISLKL